MVCGLGGGIVDCRPAPDAGSRRVPTAGEFQKCTSRPRNRFALANGPTRLTKVRNIKRQLEEGYAPERDFYRGVREAIVGFHEERRKWSFLEERVDSAHKSRRTHYQEIAKGYRKFLTKRKRLWFPPNSAPWKHGGLTVKVNPELGLRLDGTRDLLKLYCKSDSLSQRRAEVALHVMREAVGSRQSRVGLVDARRGKLYVPKRSSDDMAVFLAGEAAAFSEMWARV